MLRDRENFHIMAGTSGTTLIGWLFVVVTPGANWTTSPGKLGLPTLVHFCGVLFIAMAVLVPWPSVWPVSIILGPCGLIGLAWQAHTIRMKHRQDFVSLGVAGLDSTRWLCGPWQCEPDRRRGRAGRREAIHAIRHRGRRHAHSDRRDQRGLAHHVVNRQESGRGIVTWSPRSFGIARTGHSHFAQPNSA